MLSKQEKILKIIRAGCVEKKNERWHTLASLEEANKNPEDPQSVLSAVQAVLKRYGNLYYKLLILLGPVLPSWIARKKISSILSRHSAADIVVNLGSGPEVFAGRADIINVDISPFECVDIVASADGLPLENETVDLVINVAMLEHTKNPEKIVAEMQRILKPNAVAILFVPFLQPFHAAPSDYGRWTHVGAAHLSAGFKDVEILVGAGPTSSLLWLFQRWLALLLSFGIKPLHDVIFLLLMIITFPLKYLDVFMVMLPGAEGIASGYYIMAKKK